MIANTTKNRMGAHSANSTSVAPLRLRFFKSLTLLAVSSAPLADGVVGESDHRSHQLLAAET